MDNKYNVTFIDKDGNNISFCNSECFTFNKPEEVNIFLEIFTQYDAERVDINVLQSDVVIKQISFGIDEIELISSDI